MQIGDMVRAYGPPMKLVSVQHGVAKCLLVDYDGIIRYRFHHIDEITPMRLSLQPRSLWPTVTHVDLIEVAEEERRSRAAKKASRRLTNRAKRRSRRIKRLVSP
ncbi:hypothetical protein [Bradyrhizobium liaoningense]|uniref:hypothetical protein n=1 Tax=Bradyrhizobium liaoningense TaxID=43992 RepID=UPI001BA6FC6A|nr:hypothetical protein [Bradyrhizobium liaoningense]MBR0945960.1 hypothetical protein [Bradyrhizobium liaoningense]